jgi:hypothetical protein
MILRLAQQLDVPLRERNVLLLSGGYAPVYPANGLADPPMAAVHEAIEHVLRAHEPFPAVVIDAGWDMVAANDAVPLLTEGAAAALLEPPVNVLRLSLHPDGMAPHIVNLAEWRAHLLDRLSRDIETTADPALIALREELAAYPSPPPASRPDNRAILVPLRLRVRDAVLSLFSTTSVFGTPRDVMLSELAIESFYPADAPTTAFLRGTRLLAAFPQDRRSPGGVAESHGRGLKPVALGHELRGRLRQRRPRCRRGVDPGRQFGVPGGWLRSGRRRQELDRHGCRSGALPVELQ